MVVLERELNPYERATEFCRRQIKKWSKHRPNLVKAYTDELNHWNKAYDQYLTTVMR